VRRLVAALVVKIVDWRDYESGDKSTSINISVVMAEEYDVF
jgi:hypothetical protein